MSELATQSTQLAQQKPHLDDFGQLRPQDFGFSFVKFVYQGSRSGTNQWGTLQAPNAQQPQMPGFGTMYLSRNGFVIPPGTPFVPLLRRPRYIRWRDQKPGAGMLYMTHDPEDARVIKERGLEWRPDPTDPTGKKQLPPLVTAYINFYCFVPVAPDAPVILSFHKTGYVDGKKFTQDLFALAQGGELPMYSQKFAFNTPQMIDDGKNKWFRFTFIPQGQVRADFLPTLKKMHDDAKAIDAILTGAEFSGVEDAEEETPTTPSQPTPPQTPNALETAPNTPAPALIIPAAPTPAAPTAPPQQTTIANAPATTPLF